MPNSFADNLNPDNLSAPDNQEIIGELNEINESEYIKKIRAKNRKELIKLDLIERERIAAHIKKLYDNNIGKHNELCDRLDEYDDVFRMKRNSMPGDSDDTPNYRTPLSTVTLEVIHANVMNVFFTPADVMRIIPTEAGDIPKIQKLDTFGNWSMKNEMNLFENTDKLFHSSDKNGECPYIIHWVKEYGTDIEIELIMDPMNPDRPLIDPDTKEPLTQERNVEKILYDGPKFEVFSRKDYMRPANSVAGKLNDWDMRFIRTNADNVKRAENEGRYYDGVFDDIGGWGQESITSELNKLKDKEGEQVILGPTEKIFIEFYGRLRVIMIKDDKKSQEDAYEELEDELIGIVEIKSETLCALRKNKFPLKMRPIGLDVFIPDDEGRAEGTGVIEFMEGPQKCYDALYNQYLFGTVQSNNPIIFFTPMGNMKNEPIKIQAGWAYPTADAKNINIVKMPPPDSSLRQMMEEARNFAQLLFGISDYASGIESSIDPTAPAKKAEIVVAQGNVRLNMIIKRKNETLRDIFKRWFLLYQANMPPNKFMRIAGEDKNNSWKFEPIKITDFALKSIPDFELTGNVLNTNKTLEAQKVVGIYNMLISNPFFSPQTGQGMQALYALTKWFMDKLDETGISNFLPNIPEQNILTPEEENARMLQGDKVEPTQREDFVTHIRIHGTQLLDPSIPDEMKVMIADHIRATVAMMKNIMTQQMAMAQLPQGGMNAPAGRENQAGAGAPANIERPIPEPGMGASQGGVGAGAPQL